MCFVCTLIKAKIQTVWSAVRQKKNENLYDKFTVSRMFLVAFYVYSRPWSSSLLFQAVVAILWMPVEYAEVNVWRQWIGWIIIPFQNMYTEMLKLGHHKLMGQIRIQTFDFLSVLYLHYLSPVPQQKNEELKSKKSSSVITRVWRCRL